ncbi:MAG TPA: cytochrome c oxidase subunit 3 [Polyangia bacterium]|nr:cytochrome c oxidase subunit 3 [Polyangia bacterium]
MSTAAVRRETDSAVGLLVFMGATAMLFAALLLAYAILRAQAPAWPPPGAPPFPRAAAGLNTLLLVAASLALRRWRAAAAALGVGFLAGQVVLWRHLIAIGLGPAGGHAALLGQIFLALSALHALHVAGGLVALALGGGKLRLIAMYWDFVLVVWVVLYAAVCWV